MTAQKNYKDSRLNLNQCVYLRNKKLYYSSWYRTLETLKTWFSWNSVCVFAPKDQSAFNLVTTDLHSGWWTCKCIKYLQNGAQVEHSSNSRSRDIVLKIIKKQFKFPCQHKFLKSSAQIAQVLIFLTRSISKVALMTHFISSLTVC